MHSPVYEIGCYGGSESDHGEAKLVAARQGQTPDDGNERHLDPHSRPLAENATGQDDGEERGGALYRLGERHCYMLQRD